MASAPSAAGAWPGEMFPDTRTRRLTAADVAGWDEDKLRYAINEIYARGGYDFATHEIKDIFMRLSWYGDRVVIGRSQDEAARHLSPLENANLEFLQRIRQARVH